MNFRWGGRRSPPPRNAGGWAAPSLPPEFREGVGGAKPPPPTPIQKGAVQKGPIQKGPIQKGLIQKGRIQKGPIQKGRIQNIPKYHPK